MADHHLMAAAREQARKAYADLPDDRFPNGRSEAIEALAQAYLSDLEREAERRREFRLDDLAAACGVRRFGG